MARDITSKNIDGITDLVVVAPIKAEFIDAYENVTYASRLKIVAEALNKVRVAARERETITPFSDVTERILTLLDFRVGVLDQNMFTLPGGDANHAKADLQATRYLYLTATFDGAWEPYMRLIWDPLGPFLDLLFCNCEGYVTAWDHSFGDYARWVRDHQVDSAIFYATTGLTVRDHLYLNRLEQVHRASPAGVADRIAAQLTMPQPEAAATAERRKAATDLAQPSPDPRQLLKIHELALEALTVLYRLADYYPPEWLTGAGQGEGHLLVRAAEALLKGWDDLLPPHLPPLSQAIRKTYADPLNWFENGRKRLRELEGMRTPPKDPPFDPSEIQGGLLKPQGSRDAPMCQGALLLMTVTASAPARQFIASLLDGDAINFAAGLGATPGDGFFRSIAFTPDGLRRLGLERSVLDRFPKEFREGMEMRSGLVGDMRENHPENWRLPARNWPPLPPGADAFAAARPPIEPSEIDIVLEVRTADPDRNALLDEIARLARAAEPGVVLQGHELLTIRYDQGGGFIDHFGFHDGVSQPRPVPNLDDALRTRDEVRLGELLLGYANDRSDFAPAARGGDGGQDTVPDRDAQAQALQFNGSFLVVRKLEQHVETFHTKIREEVIRINRDHPALPTPMTEDALKARIIGRYPDGRPLLSTPDQSLNNFDYDQADAGLCPLAAHIRRANPRDIVHGRRAPRLLRRGMSYDNRDAAGRGGRGLMFMAYNASIAEQFETIQRWLNGGNSTHLASGNNDPLLGVAPKSGALTPVERVFRWAEGDEVIRVSLAEPFVQLLWGLYLFVPSRSALRQLSALANEHRILEKPVPAEGRAVIARLQASRQGPDGGEWKRLLEDFDVKDPALGDVTPHVWAAIRDDLAGSIRIDPLVETATVDWNQPPDPASQAIIVSASHTQVMRVLADWRTFTIEEQLRRIEPTGIPIFVTQQPDDVYKADHLNGRFCYRDEAERTNEILMAYSREDGFTAGYDAGTQVLDDLKRSSGPRGYIKLELRRQYLLPALEGLCKRWYGLPDGETFQSGAWSWEPPASRETPGPNCPGDFLSPSRATFYPRPSPFVEALGASHGAAIHDGITAFVKKHRSDHSGLGSIAQRMFEDIADDDVLGRNLVGTMIGAIPPMDGNLRGILFEWLGERSLWRHQAALRRAVGDRPAPAAIDQALGALYGSVSQAMCKRPAPDLLYRTVLKSDGDMKERDLVVVSLVSASQHSLFETRDGDVSIVFGGDRCKAYQPDTADLKHPVHACPAQPLAMGAVIGILAALLDSGRIQALPASLIVKISDWPPLPPLPAPESA